MSVCVCGCVHVCEHVKAQMFSLNESERVIEQDLLQTERWHVSSCHNTCYRDIKMHPTVLYLQFNLHYFLC